MPQTLPGGCWPRATEMTGGGGRPGWRGLAGAAQGWGSRMSEHAATPTQQVPEGGRSELRKSLGLSAVWTTRWLCYSDKCGSLIMEAVERARGLRPWGNGWGFGAHPLSPAPALAHFVTWEDKGKKGLRWTTGHTAWVL